MKKILSIILALSIILIPNAYAAEKTPDNNSFTEALQDLGIMQGDENGSLNGDKLLTRAEFAALVCRIMKENIAASTSSFVDVPLTHWGAADIGFMAQRGIIEGYGNGCFGPDDKVTLSQAVKILLSVLGLDRTDFSYPHDYLMCAAENGLTVGVEVLPDAFLTRNDAAALIINALYIPDKDANMLIHKNKCKTYYVSPDGDDKNDGSFKGAWKTLEHAAKNVKGYALIYLAEGIYEEEKITFLSGGESAEKPLIVRTMPGQEAVLCNADIKIADGADYISVKGLTFTQTQEISDEAAQTEKTPLINCRGDYFTLKNNTVQMETPFLMTENAVGSVIENNTFSGGMCAAAIYGGENAVIKENTFNAQSEVSICVQGGKKIKIYNNEFSSAEKLAEGALILGSDADGNKTTDCAVWNNVFKASKDEAQGAGIVLCGTKNCHIYNNILDGLNGGLKFLGENTQTASKNNIFLECSDSAYVMDSSPTSFATGNNCYYMSYPEIKEKDSSFAEPYFVSRGTDWRMMSDSPAVNVGVKLSGEILCGDGSVLSLDMRDVTGKERGDTWYPGIYAQLSEDFFNSADDGEDSEAEVVLLKQDFTRNVTDMLTSGGDWKVSGGKYVQNSTAAARTTTVYKLGEDWTNYEYSADVESSGATGNASGLIFRADLGMTNMYTFRFLSDDILEFAKWQNGSFASIEQWDYVFNTDKIYNMKVKAVGNKFAFYINGVLVRECQDNSFLSGTVGLYSFRETNKYDTMKVIQAY